MVICSGMRPALAAGLRQETPTTHTVQAGETLSEIAKANGVSMQALMQVNGIVDPDAIYVGQRLRLPAAAEAPTEAQEVTPSSIVTHTVQAGETLSEIAKTYGVPLPDLLARNDIADPDSVRAGQVLRLPDVTAGSVPTSTAPAPAESTATPIAAAALVAPKVRSATLNRTYTVRSGDTVALIALRMGVDETALRLLNRLDEEGAGGLTAGQELILPATGDELRVTVPAQEYIVQPGDSLGLIAKEHGVSLVQLLQANYIADPNTIVVGQHLTIPGRPALEAGGQPLQVGPARRGFFFHTVRPGDTLSELARDFDSTVLALLEYNDLPNEQTVYSGLEIRIPFGAPPLPRRLPPVPLSATSFLVSLSRQECWVFQGDQVRYSWKCSTGYGEWITRTGAFAVQTKLEMAKSRAYQLDMPYWLGIYNVGKYENGIHGLPIEWATGKKIWSSLIGRPATFGCAMLDDADAATLFELAYIGMPVYVVQ